MPYTFLILLVLLTGTKPDASTTNECLRKIKGEWGKSTECSKSFNSYSVQFVNDCQDTLDIKIAVQEKSGYWKTFKFHQVVPGDLVTGHACNGTGKYITWSRPKDDTSILFPSDSEINRDYK